jgi:hypothetical protein
MREIAMFAQTLLFVAFALLSDRLNYIYTHKQYTVKGNNYRTHYMQQKKVLCASANKICLKNKVSFYEKQQFTKVNAQAISIMSSAYHLRNHDLGQSGIKKVKKINIYSLLSISWVIIFK